MILQYILNVMKKDSFFFNFIIIDVTEGRERGRVDVCVCADKT